MLLCNAMDIAIMGRTSWADVWFSTYKEGQSPKLAAIIAEVSQEPLSNGSSAPSASNHERFSPNHREIEVLRFVVQGLANKEIAAQMTISESAVKNTLQQLFARTGVRTRSQLVRVALEEYRDLL